MKNRILCFFAILVMALACGISVASAEETPDFFSMTPSEFFQLDQVRQTIDLSKVDNQLLSAAIFHETNRQRDLNGLQPLVYVPGLEEAARTHAQNMAEGNYLSHTNPENPKLRTPRDRVNLAGLDPNYVAENVATQFGIQYESGRDVYINEKNGVTEFRITRESPAIPNHTYRTFARSLLKRWMASRGHRRNILSERAESVGTACARGNREGIPKFYCVQVFAGNAVLPVYALYPRRRSGR